MRWRRRWRWNIWHKVRRRGRWRRWLWLIVLRIFLMVIRIRLNASPSPFFMIPLRIISIIIIFFLIRYTNGAGDGSFIINRKRIRYLLFFFIVWSFVIILIFIGVNLLVRWHGIFIFILIHFCFRIGLFVIVRILIIVIFFQIKRPGLIMVGLRHKTYSFIMRFFFICVISLLIFSIINWCLRFFFDFCLENGRGSRSVGGAVAWSILIIRWFIHLFLIHPNHGILENLWIRHNLIKGLKKLLMYKRISLRKRNSLVHIFKQLRLIKNLILIFMVIPDQLRFQWLIGLGG